MESVAMSYSIYASLLVTQNGNCETIRNIIFHPNEHQNTHTHFIWTVLIFTFFEAKRVEIGK